MEMKCHSFPSLPQTKASPLIWWQEEWGLWISSSPFSLNWMWMVNARTCLPEAKGTEQNTRLNIKHCWAGYLLRKIEGSYLMLRSSILASNCFSLKLSDKFKPWPTLRISNGSQLHLSCPSPCWKGHFSYLQMVYVPFTHQRNIIVW